MQARDRTLDELKAWCSEVKVLSERHVNDGLSFARVIVAKLSDEHAIACTPHAAERERNTLLLALDTAYCLWLDDYFEEKPHKASSLLEWAALPFPIAPPDDLPARALAHLCDRFRQEAASEQSYTTWADTLRNMLRALHKDALISAEPHLYSYTEYLENGERSSTIPHVFATISLIFGIDTRSRMADDRSSAMLRHLSLTIRLMNDLMSLDRERADGEHSNAVILMETFMPTLNAIEFVAAQRRAHELLLEQYLDDLGEGDPFVHIARTLTFAAEQFHSDPRERYSERIPPTYS